MSFLIIPGHIQRYWGYLDDQGVIHVKRYHTDWDLQKCEQMPFCRGIFDPFTAANKREALQKCQDKLKEMKYYEKKEN